MEIRNLLENGVSVSEAARGLGVARATVRKYADMPSFITYIREKKKPHKLEPYKEYIKGRLEKYPLSSVRLYEEILKMGYTGKISRLRDFVMELHHEKAYHAVMMFETAPGQQGQIDWGEVGKMQTDEGEVKIYVFCMILGYSRTRYIEFTLSMNLETLLKCQMNAYDYYGGAPNEHLYDNMKTVVLVRGKTSDESDFNPRFADFAAYYGFKPKLCRPCKPRTKGKVEKLGLHP
ncbi:MAG: IS21 family transposase [Candidatus Micrarchaeota archaeon]